MKTIITLIGLIITCIFIPYVGLAMIILCLINWDKYSQVCYVLFKFLLILILVLIAFIMLVGILV